MPDGTLQPEPEDSFVSFPPEERGEMAPDEASLKHLEEALGELAAALRTATPPDALEKRVMDAAFAAGHLRKAAPRESAQEPPVRADGGRAPRRALGWGLGVAAASLCLWVAVSHWSGASDSGNLPEPGVAEAVPPAPAEPTEQPVLIQTKPQERPAGQRTRRRAVAARRAPTQPVVNPEPVGAASEPAEEGNPQTEELAAAPPRAWEEQDLLGAASQMHLAAMPVTAPVPMTRNEPLQTLRVRVGAEDLWRMGLTAMPPATNQPVLADFLLGEDGRPLGIRLVRH